MKKTKIRLSSFAFGKNEISILLQGIHWQNICLLPPYGVTRDAWVEWGQTDRRRYFWLVTQACLYPFTVGPLYKGTQETSLFCFFYSVICLRKRGFICGVSYIVVFNTWSTALKHIWIILGWATLSPFTPHVQSHPVE